MRCSSRSLQVKGSVNISDMIYKCESLTWAVTVIT